MYKAAKIGGAGLGSMYTGAKLGGSGLGGSYSPIGTILGFNPGEYKKILGFMESQSRKAYNGPKDICMRDPSSDPLNYTPWVTNSSKTENYQNQPIPKNEMLNSSKPNMSYNFTTPFNIAGLPMNSTSNPLIYGQLPQVPKKPINY